MRVLQGSLLVVEGLGALLTWPGLLLGLTGVVVTVYRAVARTGSPPLLMAAAWVGMVGAVLAPWISLIGDGDEGGGAKYLLSAFVCLLFLDAEAIRAGVTELRARYDGIGLRRGLTATLAVLICYYGYHQAYVYSDLPERGNTTRNVESETEEAFAAMVEGDFASARAAYQRLVATNPGYAPAHFGLGVADFHLEGPESAQRGFARAIDCFPWYAEAYIGLAATKIRMQDFTGAVDVLERGLKQMPEYMPAHLLLAQTQAMLGETEQGVHHFRAYMEKVSIARRRLIQFCDGMLERFPVATHPGRNERFSVIRAALEAAFGTPEEGVLGKDWRRILYTHLDHRGLYVEGGQGTALMELDDWSVHLRLGNLYLGSGRPEQAIEQYNTGLQLFPTDAISMNNLGVVLAQKGKLDESESLWRKAIAIRPDFQEAHHNLGCLLAKKGMDEASRKHFALSAKTSGRETRALTYWYVETIPDVPRGLQLSN